MHTCTINTHVETVVEDAVDDVVEECASDLAEELDDVHSYDDADGEGSPAVAGDDLAGLVQAAHSDSSILSEFYSMLDGASEGSPDPSV